MKRRVAGELLNAHHAVLAENAAELLQPFRRQILGFRRLHRKTGSCSMMIDYMKILRKVNHIHAWLFLFTVQVVSEFERLRLREFYGGRSISSDKTRAHAVGGFNWGFAIRRPRRI